MSRLLFDDARRVVPINGVITYHKRPLERFCSLFFLGDM